MGSLSAAKRLKFEAARLQLLAFERTGPFADEPRVLRTRRGRRAARPAPPPTPLSPSQTMPFTINKSNFMRLAHKFAAEQDVHHVGASCLRLIGWMLESGDYEIDTRCIWGAPSRVWGLDARQRGRGAASRYELQAITMAPASSRGSRPCTPSTRTPGVAAVILGWSPSRSAARSISRTKSWSRRCLATSNK